MANLTKKHCRVAFATDMDATRAKHLADEFREKKLAATAHVYHIRGTDGKSYLVYESKDTLSDTTSWRTAL